MADRNYLNRAILSLGLIPFLILATMIDVGAGGDSTWPQFDYEKVKEKQRITPGYNKVSSTINKVVNQMNVRGITRQNVKELDASTLSNPLVKVNAKGSIQTYIYVYTFGGEERALLESYEVAIEVVNEKHKIIQAWIPFDKIYQVAQLNFVKKITPPNYGYPRTGSVTTEGDVIHRASELRIAEGLDGTGVKVGVISDGVDNLSSAQASGDLPAGITIQTYAGSGDEGTAMLEIVHDLAPGAELGFCGPDTSLEMINCVNDLADQTKFGADIVVDDLGFIFEPYFEDGPLAQAVAGVLSNVIYASAAGNSAQKHYQGNFIGTIVHLSYPEHDFGLAAGGASDVTMNILLYPGTTWIVLQWNDPFGGSGNDYDLIVTDQAESEPLAVSSGTQDGDDDPIEGLFLINPNPGPVRLKVVVPKFSGADKLVKLFFFGSVVLEEYSVPGGSVFGHPAVPAVLATGAIGASDPGNDTIESFSSQGPVEIFFPTRETRQKPDVSAIDGVSITGAGGFPSPFFGTSAAAPHVAGIAALLKQLCSSQERIGNALKSSAVDLGVPGQDNIYGAGLIDASAAASALELICQKAMPGIPLLLLED
ncbi:MAG: S8 family peptidase [Planctomycetota bacterium]|jgi:subtilisin family serine protease